MGLEKTLKYNDQGTVLHPYDENGKFGYVDENNHIVIPCKWADAGEFSEGLAPVMNEEGLWGYINTEGNLTIPCIYSFVSGFSNGLALVSEYQDDDKIVDNEAYIDKSGVLIGYTYYYNYPEIVTMYNSLLLARQKKYKEAIDMILPLAEVIKSDSLPRQRLIMYYGLNNQIDKYIEWCERTFDMFDSPCKESWPLLWLGDLYREGEGVEIDLLKSFHYYNQAREEVGDLYSVEKMEDLLNEHPELRDYSEVKDALHSYEVYFDDGEEDF